MQGTYLRLLKKSTSEATGITAAIDLDYTTQQCSAAVSKLNSDNQERAEAAAKSARAGSRLETGKVH
jgi:hypothetical protein